MTPDLAAPRPRRSNGPVITSPATPPAPLRVHQVKAVHPLRIVPSDTHATAPEAPGTDGSDATPGLEWAVGAVAQRLDVPVATLRSWDRRYGVGPSRRSAGGHRRYDEGDVRRIELMLRYTATGVPCQTAARVVLAMDGRRVTEVLLDGRP